MWVNPKITNPVQFLYLPCQYYRHPRTWSLLNECDRTCKKGSSTGRYKHWTGLLEWNYWTGIFYIFWYRVMLFYWIPMPSTKRCTLTKYIVCKHHIIVPEKCWVQLPLICMWIYTNLLTANVLMHLFSNNSSVKGNYLAAEFAQG